MAGPGPQRRTVCPYPPHRVGHRHPRPARGVLATHSAHRGTAPAGQGHRRQGHRPTAQAVQLRQRGDRMPGPRLAHRLPGTVRARPRTVPHRPARRGKVHRRADARADHRGHERRPAPRPEGRGEPDRGGSGWMGHRPGQPVPHDPGPVRRHVPHRHRSRGRQARPVHRRRRLPRPLPPPPAADRHRRGRHPARPRRTTPAAAPGEAQCPAHRGGTVGGVRRGPAGRSRVSLGPNGQGPCG